MANPQKAKGDKAERDAVALLKERMPDVANHGAKRELGAGRAEDIGDIVRVIPETVIQVKAASDSTLGGHLRAAAKGASAQLGNAISQGYDMRFAMGMTAIPKAPTSGAVRWLATCEVWPTDLPIDPVRFNSVAKMVVWLKDDNGPHGYMAHPRTSRIAAFGQSPEDSVLVAPIEAWIAAYRQATGRFEPVPDLGGPLRLVESPVEPTVDTAPVVVDDDGLVEFDFEAYSV